jgi:hypothetical protein
VSKCQRRGRVGVRSISAQVSEALAHRSQRWNGCQRREQVSEVWTSRCQRRRCQRWNGCQTNRCQRRQRWSRCQRREQVPEAWTSRCQRRSQRWNRCQRHVSVPDTRRVPQTRRCQRHIAMPQRPRCQTPRAPDTSVRAIGVRDRSKARRSSAAPSPRTTYPFSS